MQLLEGLLERGKPLGEHARLSHDEFIRWHTEAANTLARALGNNTPEVDSFREYASYSPLALYASDGEIQQDRCRAMENSLAAIEASMRIVRAHVPMEKASMPEERRDGVFISHSSEDRAMVSGLVHDVLEVGIGVPHKDIFCVSSADQGIPAGQYFVPYIRSQVQKAKAVIAWITPQFFASPFCMCELGAAWALMPDEFIPILVDLEFKDLQAVLHGMQVLKANSKEDLNKFRDQLAKTLGLAPRATAVWENQRDAFWRSHLSNYRRDL